MCASDANDLPDRDVVSARYDDVEPDAIFLTNLPWRRDVLRPAIINLSNQPPLWTLLDAGSSRCRQLRSWLAFEASSLSGASSGFLIRNIPQKTMPHGCCSIVRDRTRPR
jgi:hypothetical protein